MTLFSRPLDISILIKRLENKAQITKKYIREIDFTMSSPYHPLRCLHGKNPIGWCGNDVVSLKVVISLLTWSYIHYWWWSSLFSFASEYESIRILSMSVTFYSQWIKTRPITLRGWNCQGAIFSLFQYPDKLCVEVQMFSQHLQGIKTWIHLVLFNRRQCIHGSLSPRAPFNCHKAIWNLKQDYVLGDTRDMSFISILFSGFINKWGVIDKAYL